MSSCDQRTDSHGLAAGRISSWVGPLRSAHQACGPRGRPHAFGASLRSSFCFLGEGLGGGKLGQNEVRAPKPVVIVEM